MRIPSLRRFLLHGSLHGLTLAALFVAMLLPAVYPLCELRPLRLLNGRHQQQRENNPACRCAPLGASPLGRLFSLVWQAKPCAKLRFHQQAKPCASCNRSPRAAVAINKQKAGQGLYTQRAPCRLSLLLWPLLSLR